MSGRESTTEAFLEGAHLYAERLKEVKEILQEASSPNARTSRPTACAGRKSATGPGATCGACFSGSWCCAYCHAGNPYQRYVESVD